MNYVWAAYGVCALVLGLYSMVVMARVRGDENNE